MRLNAESILWLILSLVLGAGVASLLVEVPDPGFALLVLIPIGLGLLAGILFKTDAITEILPFAMTIFAAPFLLMALIAATTELILALLLPTLVMYGLGVGIGVRRHALSGR